MAHRRRAGFRTLTKKDIQNELAQIETIFGMPPERFYKEWINGEIHGFEAHRLGCLYELYRVEYE